MTRVHKATTSMALAFALLATACSGVDDAGSPTADPVTPAATTVPQDPTPDRSPPVPTPQPTPMPTLEPADQPEDEAVTPPADQLAPGDYTIELAHDGRDRSYRLHVPAELLDPPPVVIALHGGGGTGQGFQEENGLDVVADREGFIAVYPEGTGVLPNRLHTWNSGFNCCGWALDNNVDDVGFLREVIVDLSARATVDTRRIYMTGHSNGSMMAYRFAAEEAGLVAAVVTVGGALAVENFAPAQPVAVLHIHSLDDPRALYEGGEGPPFPGTDRGIPHEPVMVGIEAWVQVNGCASAPTQGETVVGADVDEGQTVDRLTWDACDDGVRVEHLRLTGSGHGWPGAEISRFMESFVGTPTTLIDASEEVWAFASQFSR